MTNTDHGNPVWTTDVRRRAVQCLHLDGFTLDEIAHALHMEKGKVRAILDEMQRRQPIDPPSAFDV
jgi:hypothetical protein